MDPALAVLLRLLASIGVSAGLSLILGRWLLRLDRRGAGVVGGVCAGVALGPAVLGGLMPGVHADWMVGGVQQAAEAARIEARLSGDLESLRASGVSEIAMLERETQERAMAEVLRLEAERDRAFRSAAAGGMAAACALLAGLALGRPTRVWWAAAGAGAVAGVLALLGAAVAARASLGVEIAEACVFGAVLAGGVVAWRGSAGARSFGLGAMAVAVVGLAAVTEMWTGLTFAVVCALGMVTRLLDPGAVSGRHAQGLVEGVLVPTAAALIVSLAGRDVSAGGAVLIGGACLLAGDLQLVALWIGVNLCESGRARGRPLSTWLVRFGRGGPGWQLLLLGLAVAGSGLDPATANGSALVYALAGAAVTAEITRPGAYRAAMRFRRDLKSLDGD